MVATSVEAAAGEDEFELANLGKTPSVDVRPPRVAGAPLAMEAVLDSHVEVGAGPVDLFFLRIVRFHIAEDVLDKDGRPDPRKLEATGRLGGDLYCATTDVVAIPRPRRPKRPRERRASALTRNPWNTRFVSMRNVTVTMEEDVAKWARVWAAEHDTSVSRMLGRCCARGCGRKTRTGSPSGSGRRSASSNGTSAGEALSEASGAL